MENSQEKKNIVSGRCVLIGLGNIGQRLCRQLSRDVPLVCIEVDPESDFLEEIQAVWGENLLVIKGDATSRLVLEKAALCASDTVILSTTNEDVNLEVARILHTHFKVARVLSIGITAKGVETLENFQVEVEDLFAQSATGLRNRLQPKTKAVQEIGLGKSEIFEVEVHPNSRLARKPLAAFNPQNWRIGIIYRDGNIIVPRGDTRLRGKDKIIILGDPRVLKTVTDLLTFRFKRFPLEYGETLAAYFQGDEGDAYFDEIAYLLKVFPFKAVLFLFDRPVSFLQGRLKNIADGHHVKSLKFERAPGSIPAVAACRSLKDLKGRIGMIAFSRRSALDSLVSFPGQLLRKRALLRLIAQVSCPVLLAGGTFPYRRVAVPGFGRDSLHHALEATLEMSPDIHYQVETFLVQLSRYIASSKDLQSFDEMKKVVAELGQMYRADIRNTELRGNPVRELCGAIEDVNLMVADIGEWRGCGWVEPFLKPEVPWEVTRRTGVSTLLLPHLETLP